VFAFLPDHPFLRSDMPDALDVIVGQCVMSDSIRVEAVEDRARERVTFPAVQYPLADGARPGGAIID
jgi:hypothetical protein